MTKNRNSMRGLAGLARMAFAVVAIASTTFGAAQAAGIPVIDPAAIAQVTKTVAQGAQQLQAINNTLNEVNKLSTSVGKIGPGMASSILGDVGLDFNRQQDPLKLLDGAMPRIIDALPQSQAGRALGVSASVANGAKTSIEGGRRFVNQAFYTKSVQAGALAQRNQVREAALRDAASSGYALAVVQKNDIANMEVVMKGLAEKVTQATDLRSDISANTAVLMASLKAQTNNNAMLAQLVELEAAQAIAADRR